MKITCIDDARSYERVLYALRSLPQGKAVRSYVDDIKRDLRAFYHRPDGCVKIITADYDSGWQLITLTSKTKEDANAEFNDLYYRVCTPSQYDCTGQMFTVSYKLFKRNARWMAYHHFAMDV